MEPILRSITILANGLQALFTTLDFFLKLRQFLGIGAQRKLIRHHNAFIVEYQPSFYAKEPFQ
jgi:hypothetical protein